MIGNSCRLMNLNIGAAVVLTGLMAASCAPQRSSPQQMETTNPTITYKYRSDQELVQANQNAATFCNRYQSVPQTANFTNDPDGSRVVVFECMKTAATPPPQFDPNLTYKYRTDQELLDASRNAQVYCMNKGAQQVISNITPNVDGTKTITFQCSQGRAAA